jgi:cytochrome P450/NADPH-cytochrome P450 reductase
LMGVYREKSGASEEDAQRWIDNMGTQNRYVLDVWTGG